MVPGGCSFVRSSSLTHSVRDASPFSQKHSLTVLCVALVFWLILRDPTASFIVCSCGNRAGCCSKLKASRGASVALWLGEWRRGDGSKAPPLHG